MRDDGEDKPQEKKTLNVFKLLIPSLFDMTETSLKNVTLTMISTSVTQMLRSSVVVFSALLALIFLKKKLYRHHVTSIVIIVTGIFLGGLSQVLNSSKEVLLKPIGVIIVLVAQLFGATGYVVEEKFLGDFDDVDPIYMIGMEGLWSLLIWCIVLPILQIIPCANPDLCPFGRLENTLQAFEQLRMQPMHALWLSMLILMNPVLSCSSITITKYGSAS